MPTIASSIATTAASRTRPAHRSSDRKYGTAMRQIMLRVDMRPDTIVLPIRRAGSFYLPLVQSGTLRPHQNLLRNEALTGKAYPHLCCLAGIQPLRLWQGL